MTDNDAPYTDNTYPNPAAAPGSSFPEPVPPPDAEPDADVVNVQYNPAWSPVLVAAADQLRNPATWSADHDETILALARADTLKWLVQHPVYADNQVHTPFWDEPGDVGETATAEEQGWYGKVDDAEAAADEITWQENLAIWIFTGLIAVTATPAAAIFYRTVAPRFVLAIKARDIGEIIRIIVDGAEVRRIDTSSRPGEVINTTVVPDSEVSIHDIYMVYVGAAQ